MSLWEKALGIGKIVGGIIPFVVACYTGVTLAQAQNIERRLANIEITSARQDERYHAIVARIDSIDKTLWWLVVATFSGTGVSGAVAADRVVHKRKNRS